MTRTSRSSSRGNHPPRSGGGAKRPFAPPLAGARGTCPQLKGRGLAILVCAVLTGCGGVGTGGSTGGYVSGNGAITTVAPDHREQAPTLSGEDLEGRALDAADLGGDVLVVNVWGSWCPPCRKEAPALSEVARQYRDRGVRFLGLLVRDKPAAALAFTRKQETPYPTIVDSSGRLQLGFASSLPSQAIPTTWIIDAKGRVAARVMDDVSASTLAGLLDDVLGDES